MARTIYNAGRVVGYSAYEVYVKQQQAEYPNTPPGTEKEWLASSIAMGSSMVVKVPRNTEHSENEVWMVDIQFPSNSRLCAANTILGSFFKGEAVYDGNWATRISSYGDLISNTSASSPDGTTTPTSSIPVGTLDAWTDAEKAVLADYLKIIDGIVIQPGTWSNSTVTPPQKDFSPDLDTYPRLRLQIIGPLENDVPLLLTGFTIRNVVQGVAKLDTVTNSESPADGDFLGPASFPWSTKIVFSVPNSYVSYFMSNAYIRKLPTSGQSINVKDTAVTDMQTSRPETYYESNYPDAREPVSVDYYSTLGDGTAVLTVFQRKDKFPPALWGTFVDSTGTNYLNPLDVVAPGTVKMFDNPDDVTDYEDTFPGTSGIYKDEEGHIYVTDETGELVPAGADISIQDINYTNPGGGATKAKAIVTKSGHDTSMTLSVSNGLNGTQYTVGDDRNSADTTVGNTSFKQGTLTRITPDSSNVTIAAILEMLANNKSLDVLGSNLKAVKAGLPRNYIQFPNGLRLYISSTQPTDTDVPEGSIGIGWGME